MSNLRNRKRFASVLVALMLVFVVGAAFAFDAGILTIGGTLDFTFEPEYAIWSAGGDIGQTYTQAEFGIGLHTTTAAPSYVATPLAGFTEEADVTIGALVDVRDRDQQHLPVEIDFPEPGRVVLTLTPVNRCPSNAASLTAGISVLNAADSEWTDLYLTPPTAGASGWVTELADGVTLTLTNAVQTIPELHSVGNMGIGEPVTLTIEWDGTGLPDDFNIEADPGALPDPILSDNPAVSFLVSIEYDSISGVRP